MKDLTKMNEEELASLVEELYCCLDILESRITSKSKVKKDGRREEIKACFEQQDRWSCPELAKELNTTTKNIASYICYLKKETHTIDGIKYVGVPIAKDSKDRYFIEK